MKKTIVCIGTLDTKGQEVQYIKSLIEQRGHRVLVVDDGILDEPSVRADITREEVASAAGVTLEEMRALGNERKAVEAMTAGLCKVIQGLYSSGRLDGVISIGGGMGTSMATTAMRQLPLGVPKLVVSTKVAQSGVAKEYMGTKDITMVSSVADIAGLNRLTRRIASNAAGAIVGMVESPPVEISDRPLVVMSMNGTTTKCGLKVMSALEEEYEVVVFHSIGMGGRALEEFVKNESVKTVIELGLNEIGNDLFRGMASAGPKRLEAAGEKGILQIITPASVDFINFLSPDTVPPEYKNRKLIFHNPQATTLRLNSDELKKVAEVMAEKLNRAAGTVKVLIPTRGFSSWDQLGGGFYDPEADRIFIDALKDRLRSSIMVSEIDAHINDERFAKVIVEEFHKSASEWKRGD
ncbi:MAG: Tm-1-like ATP-binding domain-containing protein [Thermodesulfobacteriota bacterium]